jgi:formylglycine-generating enzyme required for sulfatase activity
MQRRDKQAKARRRDVLTWAGSALAVGALGGCGGGGSSAGSTSSGATTTSTTTGTTATTGATTTTTTTTTTTATGSPAWTATAVSTTATVPALSDFVTVIASGSVTYVFHQTTTSSTTDPVTGATADTTTSATLAPYLLSKYLVTNANWKAFCDEKGSGYWPSPSKTTGQYWAGGAYPAGKENHPVFFVSLISAQAFCAWLETRIPGYHFYVPTEGEWEYAALGTNTGYSFPWGASAGISYSASAKTLSSPYNCNAVCTEYVLNSSGVTTLTYVDDTVVTTLADGTALSADAAPLTSVLSLNSSGGVTGWQYDSDSNKTWADFANSDQFHALVYQYGGWSTAVGAYEAGKSWCGCYDLAGNAYEWTSSVNTASNGAESGTSVNVVKGGSWYATSSSGRSTGRGEGRSPSGAYHSVGFRVAARAR